MSIIIDQMGREVFISKTPKRIISLVPSQTELLYDLGLENEVVGITKFCIYPKKWKKEKVLIGGTKKFKMDVIDALKPDLIIGNKEENYQEGIDLLSQKYPVWMSDIFKLEDSLKMIEEIGCITATKPKAIEIQNNIISSFKKLPNIESKTVAYFIWNKPYMVVGSNTFIDDMLSQIGLVNVFKNKKRYFELTVDDLKSLEVDYIFLSSEPFPFKEKHSNEMKLLNPNAAIKIVDGEIFSWYGSRLQYAVHYFKTFLKN